MRIFDIIGIGIFVSMLCIFGSLWIYGIYGPHYTYNTTITIMDHGLEDGYPYVMSSDHHYYEYKIHNNWSWQHFLNLNGTINVTVIENPYGDKDIISINE